MMNTNEMDTNDRIFNKVFIISLGQLIKSDVTKTFAALADHFYQAGGLYNSLLSFYYSHNLAAFTHNLLHYIGQSVLFSIIDQYKLGELNDESFIAEMNNYLGTTLDLEQFKAIWDRMCEIDREKAIYVSNVLNATPYDAALLVVSDTNKMHKEFILAKLTEFGINLADFNNVFLATSFEQGSLNKQALATAFISEQGWNTKGTQIVSFNRDIKEVETSKAAFYYFEVKPQDDLAEIISSTVSESHIETTEPSIDHAF